MTKVVRAGAGAGKTYNLTHEVLNYTKNFESVNRFLPRVIVTTFTKKATQELTERLMSLAFSDPEFSKYKKFVSDPQQLKVTTIHAILGDFLRKHGATLGLSSAYKFLNNIEEEGLRRSLLKDLLKSDEVYLEISQAYGFSRLSSLIKAYRNEQLYSCEPVGLVEIERLTKGRISNVGWVLESFFEDSTQFDLNEKWSLLLIKMRRMNEILKSGQLAELYDEYCSLYNDLPLRGLKTKATAELYDQLKGSKELLKEFTFVGYSKEAQSKNIKFNKHFYDLIISFNKRYDEYVLKQDVVSMSDLEYLSNKLIQENPALAVDFGNQWNYWLIDEYQDTSPTQENLLSKFIGTNTRYMVGDPQQSIYLFRGASESVFSNIEKKAEIDGHVQVLEKNYRSDTATLQFINFLSHNLGSDFANMIPKDESVGGKAVANIFIDESREKIDSKKNQTDYIVGQIRDLLSSGVPAKEIGVLARRHKDLKLISDALKGAEIGCEVYGSGLYWKKQEILDVIALTRFLLHPYDRVNTLALLSHPCFCLSVADLEKFSVEFKTKNIREVLEISDLKMVRALLDGAKRHTDVGYYNVLSSLLVDLGYYDYYRSIDASGLKEGNIRKFLAIFYEHELQGDGDMRNFTEECEKSYLELSEGEAAQTSDAEKVQLMTVHASKGLQFEYVVLPFLDQSPYIETFTDLSFDEKHFSIRSSDSKGEKLVGSLFEKEFLGRKKKAEERENKRLFYVAYTRAKKFIYMTWNSKLQAESWASYLPYIETEPGQVDSESFSYEVIKGQLSSDGVNDESLYKNMSREKFAGAHGRQLAILQSSYGELNYDVLRKTFRGTLFHRLLERLKYMELPEIKDFILMNFPSEIEEASDALAYLMEQQEVPLVKLIKTGEVEWSYLKSVAGATHKKQVDLWGVVDGILWVVDYKTGSSRYLSKAQEQIREYQVDISKYLDWKGPCKNAAVFPYERKIIISS